MHRPLLTLALPLALLLAPVHGAGASTPAPAPADIAAGGAIYLEGALPGGKVLRGRGAADTTLSGKAAACVRCHRASGMGGTEGELRVPDITGQALYSKPSFHMPERPGRASTPVLPPRRFARAAYDDATLIRAISTGIDSSGARLDPLMPRYELAPREARALLAYLRQLGAAAAPGVGPGTLQLATIVTDEAEPDVRADFIATMRAWAAAGAVGNLRTPLEVWELHGDERSWPEQLAHYQAERPAFAVVSGLGGAHWNAVVGFCRQWRLPCLFPLVDAEPDGDCDYCYWFGRGVSLEAEVLADQLQRPGPIAVVQLAADAAGEIGAERFSRRYTGRSRLAALSGLQLNAGEALIAWLRPNELARLWPALSAGDAPVFLSQQLCPPENCDVPAPLRARVRWVATEIDPAKLQALQQVGVAPWQQSLGLPATGGRQAARLYTALHFFSDALARMQGHWSREYLLEQVDATMHVGNAGLLYPGLSFGPGQRQPVKGGILLGYAAPEYSRVAPLSPLVIP